MIRVSWGVTGVFNGTRSSSGARTGAYNVSATRALAEASCVTSRWRVESRRE